MNFKSKNYVPCLILVLDQSVEYVVFHRAIGCYRRTALNSIYIHMPWHDNGEIISLGRLCNHIWIRKRYRITQFSSHGLNWEDHNTQSYNDYNNFEQNNCSCLMAIAHQCNGHERAYHATDSSNSCCDSHASWPYGCWIYLQKIGLEHKRVLGKGKLKRRRMST